MQMAAMEDLRMTADNLAEARAVFVLDNNRFNAELRFYLQGNDCLAIHLGRHDAGVETLALEDYLKIHKSSIRSNISKEVARLRQEYRDQLLNSNADINWSAIKGS